MSRILVVDDEPAIGWSLREMLVDDGHDVVVAATVNEALASAARTPPDAVLLDVRLPGRDGIAAIPDLRSAAPTAAIVVMTAFGDLGTAVRAVQSGAFDYLVKPFDLDHVAAVVARALAEHPAAASPGSDADHEVPLLIGTAPPMQEVFKRIALVAGTDLPVLLTGPAGSGKDLAARAIHAHGPRRERAFVATSLSALAPSTVDGELFGRVDGGTGLLAAAAGGTILLDEIEAAPLDVQAKLLRLLETKELPLPGDGHSRPIDVRVIASTSRGLEAAAAPIRRDLADRLRVFTIALPPLADRRPDIEPLARAFLARHAAATRATTVPAMSPEFRAAIEDRDWPGNVRELRHAVEHAAVMARGGTLWPEHLPPRDATAAATGTGIERAAGGVGDAVKEWAAAARAAFGGLPEPDLHHRSVQLLEATLLREALAHTGGNRTAAARLLGLDRATLRTKLRHLGIDD